MHELNDAAALPVVWRQHSFGQPIREARPAGMSVAEIVASVPNLPARFVHDGVVLVGGQEVPRGMWPHVRPRPAHCLEYVVDVELCLAPQDGGNLRSTLLTVATIALLVGATAISGGALAPLNLFLGAGALSAGSVGASLAAGALLFGGQLALASLSPPPSIPALENSSAAAPRQSTPASLQGNVLAPGAPIPHTRGTRKVYPPIIVKPLVELVGDDEYITAAVGLSGAHELNNIRAGDTPFDDIDELEYETREGFSSDTDITLIDRQSKTDNAQIELSAHVMNPDNTDRLADQTTPENSIPKWHRMTAFGSPDEIWINLNFPQGLFDASATTESMIVPFRVRMREVGDTAWIYLPEVFFSYKKQEPFQKDFRILFQSAPSLPTPGTSRCPYLAFAMAPMLVQTPFGDMSNGANTFDGDATTISEKGGTTASAYIGANFTGAARSLGLIVVTPDPTFGLFTTVGPTGITINVRGKNGTPSNSADGTLLATLAIVGNPTTPQVLTSTDTATAYTHLFVEFVATAALSNYRVSDVRFYAQNDYSWLAHSYFWSSAISPYMNAATIGSTPVRRIGLYADRAEVYLDTGTFPKGDYEIEIKRGCVVRKSVFTVARYTSGESVDTSKYTDFFRWHLDGSSNKVTVRDQGNIYSTMVRQRFSLIWNEHPLPDVAGKLAVIAFKVKNRQLGQIAVDAAKYVYDYDAGDWDDLSTTSNPAAHLRDVLAGELNADPVPDDLIDDAALVAWRTHCASEGYEVNAVIEGQSALIEAQLIAGCGYARFRQSEVFSVIVDKDRSADAPVQTFTARNARNYGWDRPFVRLPSGLRAVYADSTNDYKETEIIVMDPDGDSGARYEEIRYDGLVTEADVETRALYDMAQARLRGNIHRWESNLQAIKCIRGDLVAVNHPVLRRQMGAAYINEIMVVSGDVTGFTLDGTVPVAGNDGFFSGPDSFIDNLYDDFFRGPFDMGFVVRLENGDELTGEWTADPDLDQTRVIELVTPVSSPVTGLAVGCLISTGELGEERYRLIVGDIVPKEGANFPNELTAVDEAPELWA